MVRQLLAQWHPDKPLDKVPASFHQKEGNTGGSHWSCFHMFPNVSSVASRLSPLVCLPRFHGNMSVSSRLEWRERVEAKEPAHWTNSYTNLPVHTRGGPLELSWAGSSKPDTKEGFLSICCLEKGQPEVLWKVDALDQHWQLVVINYMLYIYTLATESKADFSRSISGLLIHLCCWCFRPAPVLLDSKCFCLDEVERIVSQLEAESDLVAKKAMEAQERKARMRMKLQKSAVQTMLKSEVSVRQALWIRYRAVMSFWCRFELHTPLRFRYLPDSNTRVCHW